MKGELVLAIGQQGGAQPGDVADAVAVHRLDLVTRADADAFGLSIGTDAGDDGHVIVAVVEGHTGQRGGDDAVARTEGAALGKNEDEQQRRHDGPYADRKPIPPMIHGVTIRGHAGLFGRDHLPRHGDDMTFCSCGPRRSVDWRSHRDTVDGNRRENGGYMVRFGMALAAIVAISGSAAAAPQPDEAGRALDLLKASIGFQTVEGHHQVPVYAAYLKSVLVKGGFAASDVVFTPIGETGTLEATWKGSDPSLKPIVISDHMDVVAADPKDWTRSPFKAVVENGYTYGRGAIDDKFDVSVVITALTTMKQQGFKPKRTIILALSGDEETDMHTAQALAKKLKGADMVLNGDGGGGTLDENGKPLLYGLQAGEKTYADFEIAFTSAGGHSSRPGKVADNPIYRVAKAIDRIAAYQFPPQSNELTTAYLSAMAKRTPGSLGQAMQRFAANPKDTEAADELSADPEFVGQVRTTCVATMLSGGHALNALPQRAAVSVNCRIFPGVKIPEIEATLKKVVDDPDAKFAILGNPTSSDASPLEPRIMAAVKKAVAANRPGVEIVPSMSAGASDSLYFRAVGIPSYGVSGAFMKPSDDFAHGLNERSPVDAIPGALRQWHSLLTTLASE